MMKCKRVCRAWLAGILVLSLCLGGLAAPASNAKAKKAKATLKTKSLTIVKGKSKTIKLKRKNKKCKYTYKSNKKKIAKVSKTGKVRGLKVGNAKITVTEIAKKGKGKKRKVGVVKVKVKKAPKKNNNSNQNTVPNTPNVPATPNTPNTPSTPDTPVTPNKPTLGGPSSIKVYMDSMSDENLIAEVEGPGIDPTPTPPPVVTGPTPVPQPTEIYNVNFEDSKTEPFKARISGEKLEVIDGGANNTGKCLSVSGRKASYEGVKVSIDEVDAGNTYAVSFYIKQTTDKAIKINTTLQYVDVEGTEKYDTLKSYDVPSNKWTKIEFTTKKIPENKGEVSIYWETPYSTTDPDISDFCLDEFVLTGIPRVDDGKKTPDLSTGLIKGKIGNPIMTSRLTADPYVMEYDGRLYVYGTNDSQQYKANPEEANNYSYINTLNCYSTTDMVNWTDHGTIPVKKAAAWSANSWAPAITHKTINGKEKFFLYFANNASSIGVLTADSPTGPWTDPIGKALIDRDTPGCTADKVPWLFDPAVLVDDDGQGYLYFGGIGDTKDKPDSFIKNPKCARVIKLGDDMVSTVGEAVEIDAPYMFEDSGINKFNGKYYYSYCTNWTNHTGRKVGIANIAVMESDNPMTGFKYVGTVLKNPGDYFGSGASGNNHHCFTEFKGKKYAFYHTKKDSMILGTPADFRTTYADILNMGDNGDFTNKDGSVADTKMTAAGLPSIGFVNPFETVEAETFSMASKAGTTAVTANSSNTLWNGANQALFNAKPGAYVGVSDVEFGTDGAASITMKMSGVATEDFKDYTAALKKKVTGKHTIYFVFNKCDFLVDSWKFAK